MFVGIKKINIISQNSLSETDLNYHAFYLAILLPVRKYIFTSKLKLLSSLRISTCSSRAIMKATKTTKTTNFNPFFQMKDVLTIWSITHFTANSTSFGGKLSLTHRNTLNQFRLCHNQIPED